MGVFLNINMTTWKKIDNFSNYEVSSDGDVRNTNTGRYIFHNKKFKVTLKRDGNKHRRNVAWLVAKYFLEKEEDTNILTHKDGNLHNNSATNLLWKKRVKEIVGEIYGKLTIIKELESKVYNYSSGKLSTRRVLVECECGGTKEVGYGSLNNLKYKSCGCDKPTNGDVKLKSNLRKVLFRLKKSRKDEICEEWCTSTSSFVNWAVTRKTKNKSHLIRKNFNDEYCPDNCYFSNLEDYIKFKPPNRRKQGKKVYTEVELEAKRLKGVLSGMKIRCYDVENKSYHRYGGRGIKICQEWLEDRYVFIKWALENGSKKGLQIDRINNDGNYEPGNCRFVTPLVNSHNK